MAMLKRFLDGRIYIQKTISGWERQAINVPIQGTAADIIKRAMIRLPEVLRAAGLKGKMLLQVHDELVFESPEQEVQPFIDVVKSTMEHAAQPAIEFPIPLRTDAGFGLSWADAH